MADVLAFKVSLYAVDTCRGVKKKMGLGVLTDGMTGGRAKVRSRKTAFWKDTDKDRGRQLGRRISRESKRKKTTLTSKRRLYVGKCYTKTANRLTIKTTGTEPMEHIKQSNKQTETM